MTKKGLFAPIKAGDTDHASSGVSDARKAEQAETCPRSGKQLPTDDGSAALIAGAAQATVLYDQLNKDLAG